MLSKLAWPKHQNFTFAAYTFRHRIQASRIFCRMPDMLLLLRTHSSQSFDLPSTLSHVSMSFGSCNAGFYLTLWLPAHALIFTYANRNLSSSASFYNACHCPEFPPQLLLLNFASSPHSFLALGQGTDQYFSRPAFTWACLICLHQAIHLSIVPDFACSRHQSELVFPRPHTPTFSLA